MKISLLNSRYHRSIFFITIFACINLLGFVNCSPVHNLNGALDSASSTSTNPEGHQQFSCNPSQIGMSQMQRLSRREYQNTIRDLLTLINAGLYDTTVQNDINQLSDDRTNGVETTTLVYQSHIDNYFQIAYYVGGKIATTTSYLQNVPGTSGCLTSATVTDACLTNFINGFGIKVFRRPLTTAELTQYKGYYNSSTFSSKTDKIQAVIAIFLQAPDFLYRIYDQGSAVDSGTRLLTDYEFASKLSYLITGSMPDATLFTKASNGTLDTPAGVSTEIDRLLAKPEAKVAIARFFVEWLHYDTLPNMATFPSFILNGIDTTNLAANMTKEVDDVVKYTVFDQHGTIKDLLTTRASFISNTNLAQIYGINNPNGLATLDTSRTGIFSRAAFMARKAQDITSPVTRGLFLMRDVMCKTIGNPPPGAPAQPDPLQPGEFLTTRDRFNYLTVQDHSGHPVTSCVGCHGRMNPLGYTFEAFDPLGRLRPNGIEVVRGTVNGQPATQNLPINTTVTSTELGTSMTYNNHIELTQALSTSDQMTMCMSQKWLSFLAKRAPSNADNCYMNEFLTTAYGTDTTPAGSFQDIIKKTILSDRFKYWKYQ